MTTERYNELMANDAALLTTHEIEQGWHFCFEWDGLLVGPGMMEYEVCEKQGSCHRREQ